MSPEAHLRKHQWQRAAIDADQAEWSAMLRGSAMLEAGLRDNVIADALDDYTEEALPANPGQPLLPFERDDLTIELAIGDLVEEISRREQVLGGSYPYYRDGNSLTYNGTSTKVYEFCLALCRSSSLVAGDYKQLPRTFELVAGHLVGQFLGPAAEWHHTGHPRKWYGGEARFKAAMAPLSRTREWQWCPRPGEASDDPDPAEVKDEGLDFVAWRPQPDGRPGHLFVIGQCACGQNWTEKWNDCQAAKLEKWFRPLTLVPPMHAFCTPHHVTEFLLADASRTAGLVMDRARLTMLAEAGGLSEIWSRFPRAPALWDLVEIVRQGGHQIAGSARTTASKSGGGTALPTAR